MNGFQNKKSACLIRCATPFFFSPVPQTCSLKSFLNLMKHEDDIESLTNHVLDYDIRLLTISSIGPSLSFETIVSFVTLYLIVSTLVFFCSLLYIHLLRIYFPPCFSFFDPVSLSVLMILSRHITRPGIYCL